MNEREFRTNDFKETKTVAVHGKGTANEPACAEASAGRRELILKKEVFGVVGCAMEVLNELGHGMLEEPYENALAV